MEGGKDAIARLLEDAPISEAKRRKLDVEIHDALALDPSIVPDTLSQFLTSVDLVAFPFIDLWNLIQAFPSLFDVVWQDGHFRRRMEFEFNDVYRESVDIKSGQMRESLQEALYSMSRKTASKVYSNSFLPWAILYQRCKRLMVLAKNLDGQRIRVLQSFLSHRGEKYFPLKTSVFAAGDPLELQHSFCMGNGGYVATPIIRKRPDPPATTLVGFLVTNWNSEVFAKPRTLNCEGVAIVPSPIPGHFFTVTRLGKLAFFCVGAHNVQYLEVYDSQTGLRTPGEDAAKIRKAVALSVGRLRIKRRPIWRMDAIHNSSTFKITMTGGGSRHIDVESYCAFLGDPNDQKGEGVIIGDEFMGKAYDRSLYLQNEWIFDQQYEDVIVNKHNTQLAYWIVEKNGETAPGAQRLWEPTTVEYHHDAISVVAGPFFSISRHQPVQIYGGLATNPTWLLPVGSVDFEKRLRDPKTLKTQIQSSMFIVESTFNFNRILVHHPAGYTVILDLNGPGTGYVDLAILAIVGSKILVRIVSQINPPTPLRFFVLDLEQIFASNLHEIPNLIYAPCRTCSLPSVGSCACAIPYCGIECQKAHWGEHKLVCGR
jgi:hypothetical protein